MLYTDSQDMLVLSSIVALRCYNCCTDGNTSPGNYEYPRLSLPLSRTRACTHTHTHTQNDLNPLHTYRDAKFLCVYATYESGIKLSYQM
jgi:hypothetical protein